jgi:hypothetical protein
VPANYTVVEAEKTADKPDRGYGQGRSAVLQPVQPRAC